MSLYLLQTIKSCGEGGGDAGDADGGVIFSSDNSESGDGGGGRGGNSGCNGDDDIVG